MGETEPRPALASHRDRITELIEAGEPFAAGGDTTDETAGPTADAKSGGWLLAPSMCDPAERQHDGRAHLDALA